MSANSLAFDSDQEPSHIHIARPSSRSVALTPHTGVNMGNQASDSYLWSHACLLDYEEELDAARADPESLR